ncbi:MAG TPA: hypothetical protein V6C65_25080 [Allocoleopsis sp.]
MVASRSLREEFPVNFFVLCLNSLMNFLKRFDLYPAGLACDRANGIKQNKKPASAGSL